MTDDAIEAQRRVLIEHISEIQQRHEKELRPFFERLAMLDMLRPRPIVLDANQLSRELLDNLARSNGIERTVTGIRYRDPDGNLMMESTNNPGFEWPNSSDGHVTTPHMDGTPRDGR